MRFYLCLGNLQDYITEFFTISQSLQCGEKRLSVLKSKAQTCSFTAAVRQSTSTTVIFDAQKRSLTITLQVHKDSTLLDSTRQNFSRSQPHPTILPSYRSNGLSRLLFAQANHPRLFLVVVSVVVQPFWSPEPVDFLVRYKLSRVAVGTRMLFTQQHNIAWN